MTTAPASFGMTYQQEITLRDGVIPRTRPFLPRGTALQTEWSFISEHQSRGSTITLRRSDGTNGIGSPTPERKRAFSFGEQWRTLGACSNSPTLHSRSKPTGESHANSIVCDDCRRGKR